MINRDLFEDLKKRIRCDYISDLRYEPWRKYARKTIANMDLSGYPLFAIGDAANYLYGEKMEFGSCEDAQAYFRKKLHRVW